MSVKYLDPAMIALPVAELRPKPGTNAVTAIAPDGHVWSVDSAGNTTLKPDNFDGGHETAQVNGNLLAYHPEGDGRYVVVAFVKVNAL